MDFDAELRCAFSAWIELVSWRRLSGKRDEVLRLRSVKGAGVKVSLSPRSAQDDGETEAELILRQAQDDGGWKP
jgi:hypothetical protein